MNDRNDWNANDRWRDEERGDHGRSAHGYPGSRYTGSGYPGTTYGGPASSYRDDPDGFERDQWGRSGTSGAVTPRNDPRSGRSGSEMRGDRRTHDWEVGDRHYTGQGRPQWRDTAGGYGAASSPDWFTGEDYGGGTRAWSGSRQPGLSYGPGGYPASAGYSGRGSYGYDDGRGFVDRAVDEVRSWFGDDEAAQRREEDHRGRGPSDYTRSDERIREDVNDRLTDNPRLDARNVSVMVTEGEVTLSGTVGNREDKRRAEDCADAVSGVKHVQNNLRVRSGSNLEGQGGTLAWGGGDSSVTPTA